MTSALDNAIATATLVVAGLEANASTTSTATIAVTTLIAHLRRLDPAGTRTAELIARLEVFA